MAKLCQIAQIAVSERYDFIHVSMGEWLKERVRIVETNGIFALSVALNCDVG